MTFTYAIDWYRPTRIGLGLLGMIGAAIVVDAALAQDSLPNACPVDGCQVKIVGVKKSGGELEVTLEANFMPDMSKNHFHVWWGREFQGRAGHE